MQSKIRTTALLALLAFSSSIASAQPTVMSKETGPAASGSFSNYWSDSISYGYESINVSFSPSGYRKNPSRIFDITPTGRFAMWRTAFA